MANPLPIVIRPLRADDIGVIFSPVERGLAEQWLARQELGELYVAVAELDGQPVGRMCLDLVVEAAKHAAYCFAAGVQPEWRSRGIGSQIDVHLGRVAQARGFQALTCAVAKTNQRSRAFFERQGYRCTGEGLVSWVEGDGRYVEVDCWKFRRSLNGMIPCQAT